MAGQMKAKKSPYRYYGCSCDLNLPPRERCTKDVARCPDRASIFMEEAKQNKTGPFKERK